jgi:hypothetical protein
VVAPLVVSHLGASGLVVQSPRVRSVHPVTTNIKAMARAAITASVFMVYQGSRLRCLVSMLLESLVGLGGMSPMLHGLLVSRRLVSSQTL